MLVFVAVFRNVKVFVKRPKNVLVFVRSVDIAFLNCAVSHFRRRKPRVERSFESILYSILQFKFQQ